MTKWLALLVLTCCAPSLKLTRTTPPALHGATVVAIATSGPYALDLLGALRKALAGRVKVEACTLGCPSVGLYASATLTPGPHEGRMLRTCQLEVYEGATWVQPTVKRLELVTSVHELEECTSLMARALLEPSTDASTVRLDARGALAGAASAAQDGRLDEAERALRALLETDPSSAGAHYDLAVVLEASGRLDAAKAEYAAARASRPDEWLASQLIRAPR